MNTWIVTVKKNSGLFLIARHSKTNKQPVDKDRLLTSEGELLAVAAGKTLRQHDRLTNGRFDAVFTSPARRCRMTAEFMLPNRGRLVVLNSLYPNTPAGRVSYPNLLETFDVHGNKSIDEYCSTNKGCSGEFDRYAEAVLAEMTTHRPKGSETFVGIMTHAVLAPAVALEIARLYGCVPQFKESLEAIVLGECDAILLSPSCLELVRAPKR